MDIVSRASNGADDQLTARARIDSIIIGNRHRRDLGDIAALAASMGELGLLQPVVVRPDGILIAGERRLRAAERLGWTDIPVTVVDLDAVVKGEFAENAHRKDFTLSEAVAIKRALEPIERAAAKERMLAGKPSGNLPKGRATDKAAATTGKSRRTLEMAEAVIAAAEAEPAKYGRLCDRMERTGKAAGAYRRLHVMQQAELIRAEPSPLPGNGPYRVIVCDPPWPDNSGSDDDPSHILIPPYPTMTLREICALPVASLAASDCVLWLWATNFHVSRGIHCQVLDAWGFQPKTVLTWGKDHFIGGGNWLRSQTEHAIIAVRGKPIVELTNQTTLLHGLLRAHSQKPVEFYDLVETLCPAPRYAYLFSRYRHNDKWDCHGDEAPRRNPMVGGDTVIVDQETLPAADAEGVGHNVELG